MIKKCLLWDLNPGPLGYYLQIITKKAGKYCLKQDLNPNPIGYYQQSFTPKADPKVASYGI